MGTKPGEPEPTRGAIVDAMGRVTFITSVVSDTAYGRRGGHVWPLFLIFLAGVAMFLDPSGPITVMGGLALIALALWIGGRR